jgi:hypothetical protein
MLQNTTKELKVHSVQNKIDEQRQNRINRLDTMADDRIPKQILQCEPNRC